MGIVMVKCPQTGDEISTGLVMDRSRFRAMPVFFSRVYCRRCGVEHEWFAREAWVCEAEREPRRRRPLS